MQAYVLSVWSNHRITRVGKGLQDPRIYLSTYHRYFPTKPNTSPNVIFNNILLNYKILLNNKEFSIRILNHLVSGSRYHFFVLVLAHM